MTFFMILGAVLLDGLAALVGGLLPQRFIHKQLGNLLAFAAGTLVSAAFLHLIPDALLTYRLAPYWVFLAVIAGFALFYIVESFLGSHATGQGGHKHNAIGPLILVGDALHNMADGIAIASAFLANTHAGIATTLAVVVHELPQEIGDYAILIAHGYKRAKAMFYLFLVQLSALIGALFTYFASQYIREITPYLLSISAGGFLYVAAADLLPEIQRRKSPRGPLPKLFSFAIGIILVTLLEHLFTA